MRSPIAWMALVKSAWNGSRSQTDQTLWVYLWEKPMEKKEDTQFSRYNSYMGISCARYSIWSVQNVRVRLSFAIFLRRSFFSAYAPVHFIFVHFFSGQNRIGCSKEGSHSVCCRLLLMALDAGLFLTLNSVCVIHTSVFFFCWDKTEKNCIGTKQRRKKLANVVIKWHDKGWEIRSFIWHSQDKGDANAHKWYKFEIFGKEKKSIGRSVVWKSSDF